MKPLHRYLWLYGLFFLTLVPALRAQRIGLSAGYGFGQQKSLHEAVQQFNFTHPTHAKRQPMRHGIYASLAYAHAILGPVLFIGPRFTYWQAQNTTNSFIYPIRSTIRAFELVLDIEFYPFASRRGASRGSPFSFHRNFHLNLHAGASYLLHNIRIGQNKEPLFVKDNHYRPSAIAPLIGLGLAFDVFTLPNFSFTPELRAGYIFPFSFKDLHLAYAGTELLPEIEKSPRIYLQVGVSLRFHASERITKR